MTARPPRHRGSRVLAKALVFSLALTLVFTLTANFLPQVQGEGAPEESAVDTGNMTTEELVALGRSLFTGKGTCTLCHNDRGRAPDIAKLDLAEEAKRAIADPRYQGHAGDLEEYLRESMTKPSAFVVAGFGQKGSNDTVSPMPTIGKPPIDLVPGEIDALIAYLQAKDGHPVTVAPAPRHAGPAPAAPARKSASPAPRPAPPGDTTMTAEQTMAKYACVACHSLAGQTVLVGPPLAGVGARMGAEEIRRSILEPDATVHEGFPAGVMPKDFGDRMSAAELERIVRFLAGHEK